eukprot:5739055-Pyramimonas_sp.AAC.1
MLQDPPRLDDGGTGGGTDRRGANIVERAEVGRGRRTRNASEDGPLSYVAAQSGMSYLETSLRAQTAFDDSHLGPGAKEPSLPTVSRDCV